MGAPWKVVFAFIAVFIAGAVFGSVFALRISKQFVAREGPRPLVNPVPQPKGGAPLGTQLLRRFAEGLELSNEQRDKLRPIVQRAEDQIAQVRQSSLEQTEAVLHRLQQEFRAELTPPQQRKLNRMQQRQNEIIKEERLRRQQQQAQPPFQPGGPNQPYGPGAQGGPNQSYNQGPQGPRPVFPPNQNQGTNRPLNPLPGGQPQNFPPPNNFQPGPNPEPAPEI